MAFACHFYGKFPMELMNYKSRDLVKWYEEAIKVHNQLNKVEDG